MPDTFSSAQEDIALSRSTILSGRFGKATETLKCAVPESVKDDWIKLARTLGLSESELLLSVVMVRLDGLEKTLNMQREQLRMAVGIGQESVQSEYASRLEGSAT
jgi:hypothetical protein